jgi:undecaprenyl-diphosphatase
MNILEAILLGIVQGLTEFLPVSSSGHIELGKVLVGAKETGLDFSILVHVATAMSSVIIFRKDIFHLANDILRHRQRESMEYVGKLILSAVPVTIVGLLFLDQIEPFFTGRLVLVGAMLLLTAGLLLLTYKLPSTDKEIGWWQAVLIGIAQTIAILPGISRSGATISTALLLRSGREQAARFSFLMVLIPIFGKALMDLKDVIEEPTLWSLPVGITIGGFVAAFLSGLFACSYMLKIVKRGKLYYFSIYCAIVGVVAIVAGIWG